MRSITFAAAVEGIMSVSAILPPRPSVYGTMSGPEVPVHPTSRTLPKRAEVRAITSFEVNDEFGSRHARLVLWNQRSVAVRGSSSLGLLLFFVK